MPWNLWPGLEDSDPNFIGIHRQAEALASELHARWSAKGARCSPQELQSYEELVLLVLYYRFSPLFGELITKAASSGRPPRAPFYHEFRRDAAHLIDVLAAHGQPPRALRELQHLFAVLYQIRRAFHHIFYFLVGTSRPSANLRAAVWQSIFSHDLRRYRTALHARMADFATLILGPSGTGKELIARVIGLSRYIPFQANDAQFTEDFYGSFQELNLAALAPTLIESDPSCSGTSGAFTGATADRQGWFESCPPLGTVFLDEIGDLDPGIQVKLLRVLQRRTFQRAGETRARRFHGKVIAATHCDLAAAIEGGAFRADLYYRLFGDVIEVPSLHARLRDDPRELHHLLQFLARRELGDDSEGVVATAAAWIGSELGADYAWPGNVRELEQCLRNIILRRGYRPRRAHGPQSARAPSSVPRCSAAGSDWTNCAPLRHARARRRRHEPGSHRPAPGRGPPRRQALPRSRVRRAAACVAVTSP